MTLQQAIDLLKFSELQTLSIKDNDVAIISIINLALTELHKRFQLTTEEYVIPLQTGVSMYTMPADFMYIVEAYEETSSTSSQVNHVNVPINDESSPLSINTVGWNKLQIPITSTGSFIGVIYVPKPTYMGIADLGNELNIPDTLLDSLMLFVGYKAHTSIDGNIQEEGNTHYMRFEASIKKLKQLGIGVASDDSTITNRIHSRGFV